ncbi:MAG TPA: motility protein A [Deltaproteobacteria bacterium]|nr:motility protein A [Deltaproteobacteria bacterium]
MDFSTGVGYVACFGLVLGAILLGGAGIGAYIDPPSVLIVCGGTVAALFIGFPTPDVMNALKALKKAFMPASPKPMETVKKLEELSQRARREGLLSLEEAAEAADDDFLKRGLQMMVDGHEPSAIESVLFGEIDKIETRHKTSINVWDAIGAYAPGMGLIGTLVGLVQMLQNMSDPSSIGPAMAVALLTTFYGALLANIIGIPTANKLKQRSAEEIAHKELIAQGLISILGGENPRFMVERLNATLPPAMREEAA